jgi:hypothetical protein
MGCCLEATATHNETGFHTGDYRVDPPEALTYINRQKLYCRWDFVDDRSRHDQCKAAGASTVLLQNALVTVRS